jgi:hypothetical protein
MLQHARSCMGSWIITDLALHQIGRIEMVLLHQPDQSAFELIFSRHGDLKAENDTGVLYVGLGDQFDDDRRLVRASEALAEDVRDTRRVYAPRAVAG